MQGAVGDQPDPGQAPRGRLPAACWALLPTLVSVEGPPLRSKGASKMCRGCPGRVVGAADGPCQGRDHPGRGQRAHQERSEGSVAGSTSASARGAELSSQRTKAIWARLQAAPRSLIVRPEPSSAKARISMRVQGFGSGPDRPGPHPRHVANRRVGAGRCCPDARCVGASVRRCVGASARGPRPASCPMGWAIRREIHQDQRRSAP